MKRPSMFKNQTSPLRHGPKAVSEIDLREEVDNILFGEDGRPRHGHLVILRNMRHDSDGYPTKCVCRDASEEPDPDCSYCLGEGYLWDESWAWTFSMFVGADDGMTRRFRYQPPGAIRADYKIFYFRYDTSIEYGDKIIEVKLDENGDVELPYQRTTIYSVETIEKKRSDNGRVEYIACYCRERDAIRSDNY